MKFRIQSFKELPSTNSLALELAEQSEPEGLVITADFQSRGHGKFNRPWVSPPKKNLLFSVLLRPRLAVNQAPILTQIACRAIAGVLKTKYAIPATVKRPNDIMVNGRKICGILVESRSCGNEQIAAAVVGVGLNVNADSHELVPGAISMKMVKGRRFNRNEILKSLLEAVVKEIGTLQP